MIYWASSGEVGSLNSFPISAQRETTKIFRAHFYYVVRIVSLNMEASVHCYKPEVFDF